MGAVEEFKQSVREIAAGLSGGQQSYLGANVQLDLATSELLGAYALDTPDNVLDEAFRAYADIHVLAAEKGQISRAEASHLINDRATELFEDWRGWEAVENMVKPYWDRLEDRETEGPVNAL